MNERENLVPGSCLGSGTCEHAWNLELANGPVCTGWSSPRSWGSRGRVGVRSLNGCWSQCPRQTSLVCVAVLNFQPPAGIGQQKKSSKWNVFRSGGLDLPLRSSHCFPIMLAQELERVQRREWLKDWKTSWRERESQRAQSMPCITGSLCGALITTHKYLRGEHKFEQTL